MQALQGYLQDTSVHITVSKTFSIRNAKYYHVPVPALIPRWWLQSHQQKLVETDFGLQK